ncbi:MAG: saccharopine dehydrogenase-like oxidoreductase [Candidatus Firestonebacteria bacterium]|nr:saccharopine dehydrogenase-like oxidoreductase [Candidatus Firestonebacteria bacterium]
MDKKIKVAVLGSGGLGKSAAKIISQKKEMSLVAICDSQGYAYNKMGLNTNKIINLKSGESIKDIPEGKISNDSIGEIIKLASKIDGIFIALPNLPNDFIPSVVNRFIKKNASLVFTDALKRTRAAELMFKLNNKLKKCKSVYLVGCGATPGLLTGAAVLSAQSFIKIEKVNIWWGVGISNWEEYKATIREDIAHLPGYSVEKARAMSDEEVKSLLDKTDGKLELHEMEHADDILLERVGVVSIRNQVKVGGIMDTRNARKPVSTTMTLTGITYDGQRSSHKFILGDETTMAANVIGPALGYMKKALWLKKQGIYGIFGSTEFMPMVVK